MCEESLSWCEIIPLSLFLQWFCLVVLMSICAQSVSAEGRRGSNTSFLSEVTDWSRFVVGTEGLEVGTDDAPLDALEESVDVLCFVSAVLLEVGVLPQVDANNWDTLDIDDTMHQWIVLVVGLRDEQTALARLEA